LDPLQLFAATMMHFILLLLVCCLDVAHSFQSTFRSTHRALAFRAPLFMSADSSADADWQLSLRSPCKLNFFLRILGRRPNGFHDLASLFQTISLSDQLHFSKLPVGATADAMTCSDLSLTVDESNLVVKALQLMRDKTGLNQFFKVHLDKQVPMQAGLGGGSGNAATAMHAFNRLCDYPASAQQLLAWSGDIGSDISFFFSSGVAYCTGRGEEVQSLAPIPDSQHVEVHVFKPSEGLSTGTVFQALDLARCSPLPPLHLLDSFQTKGALGAAQQGALVNDLEAPAFQCAPLLAQLKSRLLQGEAGAVSGVMMSGSGTSVYALRDSRLSPPLDVAAILSHFPPSSLQHFQCHLLGRSDDLASWYE